MKNGYKIIDFRCRPPVPAYKTLFDLHIGRQSAENRFYCVPENTISPSMHHVGEDKGLDLLQQELDDAGIDFVLAPGRKVPEGIVVKAIGGDEPIDFNVSDEALAGLRKRFDNPKYKSRLLGTTGLELGEPIDKLVAQIKSAVKEHGLKGAVIEPGYYKAKDGSTLLCDDKTLYPLYETIIELDVFLMHQSGIYAGPDYGVNYWPPVDRLLQDFPKLKFLLAHGGYPAITDVLALAVKHQNFYLSPDIYCLFPGGEQYVNNITKLQDQFIWGTAYPMASLKESVDETLEFPLSRPVMEKFLYGNAARLLKI